jgi:predicted NBD/HSP70 family sugar kinase
MESSSGTVGRGPSSSAPAVRSGSDQATVRSLNRGVVLTIVKRAGAISRADIAKLSALTKPTVSAIVDELAEEGLLVRTGIGQASSNGGRRPVLYEFNASSSSLLGAHVGVESTVVSLADGSGRELDRDVHDTPRDPEVAFVEALRAGLRLAADATGPVHAVGIAVTGLVDHRRGRCLLAPNLGWRDVAVTDLLARHTTAPVAVHNAAQAVLAAEHLEGAVQATRDAVLLYEDRGVGSAILADGRLVHGTHGVAGEIGHCKIPGATARCGCGGRGCLETELAEPAILRRARQRVGRAAPRSLRRMAELHDAELDALLHEVGEELGHAVALLINIVNPEAVVVAGGFLDGGAELLRGIEVGLAQRALAESAGGVRLVPSALGADGPIRGAVLLARYAADRAGDPLFGMDAEAVPALSAI